MNLSQKERNTIAFIVFCLESILYLMVLWQIIFWLLEIPVFRQGILDYGWMPGNFVGRELAVAFSEESLFRLLPMVVIYTLGLNRILAIKLVVVSLTAGAFAYVHGILYLPFYASAGLMLSVLFFGSRVLLERKNTSNKTFDFISCSCFNTPLLEHIGAFN